MLTAYWQQGSSISGQHFNHEDFVHDDSVRPRTLDNDVAAADTGGTVASVGPVGTICTVLVAELAVGCALEVDGTGEALGVGVMAGDDAARPVVDVHPATAASAMITTASRGEPITALLGRQLPGVGETQADPPPQVLVALHCGGTDSQPSRGRTTAHMYRPCWMRSAARL